MWSRKSAEQLSRSHPLTPMFYPTHCENELKNSAAAGAPKGATSWGFRPNYSGKARNVFSCL